MATKKNDTNKATDVKVSDTVEVSLINTVNENIGVYVKGIYVLFVDGKATVTNEIADALKETGLV